MKRILSLDPGHTTGVAVYDSEGKLEMSLTFPVDTVKKLGFVFALTQFTAPEIVLIESLPTNYVDDLTQELWHHIMSRLDVIRPKLETFQVRPAQWKNLTVRVEIPGQHARDAATMAKWWIDNRE